jgi:TldD protein
MQAGQDVARQEDLGAWVDLAAQIARRTPGVEHFEVRADRREGRRVVLQQGALRAGAVSESVAIGVRVFAGGGSSYASTQSFDRRSLTDILEQTTRLAIANGRQGWRIFPPRLDGARKVSYAPRARVRLDGDSTTEVEALLRRTEAAALAVEKDLSLQLSFGSRAASTVLADSAGSWCEVGSLVSTLIAQAVARRDGRLSDATEWRAGERGTDGYEILGGPEALGEQAARNALEALDAVPFPAGRYRTLTDNQLSGLLAHESFGHLNEYDLVASGWSVLRGRQGDTLAAPGVTIRDAPVVDAPDEQGVRVPYDDEGSPGRVVTLLDDGVLSSWMHTRDSAADEGLAPTGNGRALDARFPPLVRMRNTYFEPGGASLDEALEALGDGVYLIGGRGGSPRSDGSFMFTAKRGYLVERGEIKAPLRSASIHGNILDFLRNVELLTSDFEVQTNAFGGCGKWDQNYIHVGTGGPHVLVSEALVGGQGG